MLAAIKNWLAWKAERFMDFLSAILGEREQCQTCGKLDKTPWHRQKCLQRSEREIYRQLRKNLKTER